MTNIVTKIKEWQIIRQQLSRHSIGFVHTMGNLHRGHLSLIERAQRENDVTVVAIFVNPTQFNQANDFEQYPRTLMQDKILLSKHQVDYLLLFDNHQLYADHYQIQISETEISQELEGKYRPNHLTGMLTIVLKFLNLVQATSAYYGEKDYQQFLLIKKMTNALFLQTDIVACSTVRDNDDIALSSRNARLTLAQHDHLKHLPRLLQSTLSVDEIIRELQTLHFKVDYVVEKWGRRLAAVWLDGVRLIDNFAL